MFPNGIKIQNSVAMLGHSDVMVNPLHSDAEFVHPFGVSISNLKHSLWHASDTKSFLPHVYCILYYLHYLEKSQPGSGGIVLKPQHLGSRGREISVFEASLVYRASFRTAKDTQRNPVSKNNKKRKQAGSPHVIIPREDHQHHPLTLKTGVWNVN